ncbi:hypothetical protein C3K47_17470 [Solitalea longa]|uniref:DUF4595 domain-containing protein n=1 Tax=Solitalea longa TaxID=2079460 RepID=A0A2S4ZXN5_9SPHI|nr:hypothetical protein [Solitalea longa]POY35046.1 hypothetical protein C3K47_17470 [Solitalea longa]
MNYLKKNCAYAMLIVATCLISCSKEDGLSPEPIEMPSDGDTSHNPGPIVSPGTYTIKIKAVIKIGEITYDSIPASLEITSWDSSHTENKKSLDLLPGVNTIKLPKNHLKYQLKLTQWGITEEKTLTGPELEQSDLLTMGGIRVARKLKSEATYRFIQDEWHPQARTHYTYNADGTLKQLTFFKKEVHVQALQLSNVHKYEYQNGRLSIIKRFDGFSNLQGSTGFAYDANGGIINMSDKQSGQETHTVVKNGFLGGNGSIDIDFLFSNGHAMEYSMQFKNGNKISDRALTSTGATEGGSYKYDFYINPFVHLNMPNLYMSNLSKNNVIDQQKGYGGSYPTTELFKIEYTYDAQGYPEKVIKSYRSPGSGSFLYDVKTEFVYW